MSLAKRHSLHVIEDAAEAHGATINGKMTGSFGDMGVFSFYGNKIITSGEGGMITTDDADTYKRARYLRDHAMAPEERYWHTEVGYNYRMTNLQAALGLGQLEQIGEFIAERARLLSLYRTALEPRGLVCNPKIGSDPVNWITCAVANGLERKRRDTVIATMRNGGVDSRPFFYPVSALPMYGAKAANPVSAALSEDGFNLPTFIGMTDAQVSQVCDTFLAALATTGWPPA